MIKILDYNMTRDYCSDWTPIEAWREIVQNCLDSNKKYECYTDVADQHGEEFISATTICYNLPMSAFAMGQSAKANSNSIGKYGEGMKLAMMILTREGLCPAIYTGNLKITGEFRENEITGLSSFCLVFEEVEHTFKDCTVMSKLGSINKELLKERVTPFADNPLPPPKAVDILMSKPGKLYVNGLYICEDSNLTFGYNFAPGHVTLNRDRNMVSGVESVLAKYYVKHGNAESIFNMLINGVHDVSYLYIYISDNVKLKAELVRLFFNKYGEGASIGAPGKSYFYSNTVSLGASAYNALRTCGLKEPESIPNPESPQGQVTKFMEENKKHMRSKAVQGANRLVKLSKGWRV